MEVESWVFSERVIHINVAATDSSTKINFFKHLFCQFSETCSEARSTYKAARQAWSH